MRAVVLVGGQGTRLRPLTWTVPKQMLPVAGVTMIERVLAQLGAHGIEDVVLSMGYRPDAFLAAYPDSRAAGVHFTCAVEPEPRDTAGAIRYAARFADVDDTFLVVNGDVLTDLNITELIGFHREKGGLATISLTPVEDPSAFGVVPTDSSGRVEAFIEKPPPGKAPTNLINAGTYVFEPQVLDLIPSDGRVSVEKETFPALVERGVLFALGSEEYWIDTGTPTLYIRASLDLVAGRRRSGAPLPGVRSDGAGVWSAPSARVAGSVGGPALLEAGCVIEAGSTVRASLIGAGVTVGKGARIDGSVILAGAVVASGAVVEGSVIGAGARIGEGATLRPVTVVGPAARVGAGETLIDARYPDEAPA